MATKRRRGDNANCVTRKSASLKLQTTFSEEKHQTTPETFCSRNPMLFPEILRIVFKVLEKDSVNLRSCREVCHVWDVEASKIIKKSCNSRVIIRTIRDLTRFQVNLSKSQNPDIYNGLILKSTLQDGQEECDDKSPSSSLAHPPSPLLWSLLKDAGEFITFLDISLVETTRMDGNLTCIPLKLVDLRKIVCSSSGCPNLKNLVLREIQWALKSKQRFVPPEEMESPYQSKIKSVVIKNKLRNDHYNLLNCNSNSRLRFHVPCLRFFSELLLCCPDLEHFGIFCHLAASSQPYLKIIGEFVEQGRLRSLKSIERVNRGLKGISRNQSHFDTSYSTNMRINFESVTICSNILLIPAQLFATISDENAGSLEVLDLTGYYCNKDNYFAAVVEFDTNKYPIAQMENLRRLCLRGGMPLEPFLLNTPNLTEVTHSMLGIKSEQNENFPSISVWNTSWYVHEISPLQNLRKVDVGHSAFHCSHDIHAIAKLCPNLMSLAVPSKLLDAVFESLPKLQELDIVLLDRDIPLHDEILIPNDGSSGISSLNDLKVLRLRVNEASKLPDGSRTFHLTCHEIAEACQLTDHFITVVSNKFPKLQIVQIEAGKFTAVGWEKLNEDKLPMLLYLEIPRVEEKSSPQVLNVLRNRLPRTQIMYANFKPTKEGYDITVGGFGGGQDM